MIRDLKLLDDVGAECEAQVCIVGAGTAGIFLARLLCRQGLRVVMLEAGDDIARTPEALGERCEQRHMKYRGADFGRSFGLGGTSALWGGQMLPLAESDFRARPKVGFDAWPIDYSELAAYWPIVRAELGLNPVSDPAEGIKSSHMQGTFPALRALSGDFVLRLSEWIPFKTRNFAKAFAATLKGDPNLTVWLNAAVTGMSRSSSATKLWVETITAESTNGRRLVVRPSMVVVCAGALESTRLLLAYDEETDGSITRTGAPLGRYFSDHLSVTCGRFACHDWRRFNLAVAPIFERGVMRTPRLELSADAQKNLGVTSAFAHFTFVTHGDTGFDLVRSILRKRQGERQDIRLSPPLLGRMVADISAMAFWRGAYQRLWIPRQADLLLQVDIEQMPNVESRLHLSGDRDDLKRKRLVIEWQILPEDVRVIRKVAEAAINAWQQSDLRKFADLQLSLPENFDSFETLYDVYHPTGPLRMGSSAADSVVNKDLRLWSTENCYVTTTAVFPSAGSANPGMTHLALTARLAEHLGNCFRFREGYDA